MLSLQGIDPTVVTDCIEKNLFDLWAYYGRDPQVQFSHRDNVIRFVSGVPCPLCNNILSAKFDDWNVDRRIDEQITYFKNLRLPMLWWVTPGSSPRNLASLLRDKGLVPNETVTGMAADLEHTEPGEEIIGYETVRVSDASTRRAWLQIFGNVFHMADHALDFFEWEMEYADRSSDTPFRHYLGFLRGEPVACSTVFYGQGVAGLYNIGTLPEFRGRRLGESLTRHTLIESQRDGLHVGILHASYMGEAMYARLGFKPFCTMEVLLLNDK